MSSTVETITDIISGGEVKKDDEDGYSINISPLSIGPLIIKLKLKYKPGDDEEEWLADANSELLIFGKSLWKSDLITLSPSLSYIHLTPRTPLGTTRADIYMGVKESKTVYVKVNLESLILGSTGWVEKDIWTF
uniref:Uncharacterized protein n=1 Tax=viral metagenome TaxID=1070528 RepID=A0A6C0J9S6_9ZZZZ